jgi:hypothetical protein
MISSLFKGDLFMKINKSYVKKIIAEETKKIFAEGEYSMQDDGRRRRISNISTPSPGGAMGPYGGPDSSRWEASSLEEIRMELEDIMMDDMAQQIGPSLAKHFPDNMNEISDTFRQVQEGLEALMSFIDEFLPREEDEMEDDEPGM